MSNTQTVTILESLIERLSQHRLIGTAPREELEWLAAHGEPLRFAEGESVIRKGDPTDQMMILLTGKVDSRIDRGSGPYKVTEWRAGQVTGVLPYSRVTHAPIDSNAEEATECLAIHRLDFPEMIRVCPTVTTICVHEMLDRARTFTAKDLQDEKIMSLGRLSAGLTHELNNPASAAARGAELIVAGIGEVETASIALGALALSDSQLAAIQDARDRCGASKIPLSTLQRGEREDAIAGWLESHHVSTFYADPLTESGLGLDDLDRLTNSLDERAVETAIRWISAGCSARALGTEMQQATSRIYELVASVKRYTHMDRPVAAEPMSLGPGLADTVTLLAVKASAKLVSVVVDVAADLPPVRVVGGEINQVWTNVLDNALDAAKEGGQVTVSARRERDWVRIGVVDDGAGIPATVGERVFDPFFTTKPPGQGTGLGLDIARRILKQCGGEITFESRPGRTEFSIRLPVAD